MPTILPDRCVAQRYDWAEKYGRRLAVPYAWRKQPHDESGVRYARARKIVDLFVRHRKRRTAGTEEAQPKNMAATPWRLQAEPLRAEFLALANRWRRETKFSSSVDDKVLHAAYQKIIAMGRPAVPLVLEELKLRRGHWFWALHFMADTDPVPEGANVDAARDAWLDWGRREGYLN